MLNDAYKQKHLLAPQTVLHFYENEEDGPIDCNVTRDEYLIQILKTKPQSMQRKYIQHP